jgi:hypothetical protein
MRVGITKIEDLKDWANASRFAGNLSELELTLGDLSSAVFDAQSSVAYSDSGSDGFAMFMRCASRAIHADALHEAGNRNEAARLFDEADQMHANQFPATPLLYGRNGFEYCDLLLAEAERAAWRLVLSQSRADCQTKQDCVTICHSVSKRASKTLSFREIPFLHSLLGPALDRLTLARACLYEVILEQSNPEICRSQIELAVSGLRRAGEQRFVPIGLLTRAWHRCLTGAETGPDTAQSDLDEAWEIAERGPMRLLMADIHLYRARLFGMTNTEGHMKNYPWASPQHDLAEARRLVESHGYWRRQEELADAEQALLGLSEDR